MPKICGRGILGPRLSKPQNTRLPTILDFGKLNLRILILRQVNFGKSYDISLISTGSIYGFRHILEVEFIETTKSTEGK